jgi:nucleoside-diphosphate-sugar epimerase
VFRAYAEGLKMVVVNPSVIMGPGNWKTGSPSLFATIDKGLHYYTNGTNGYVDVRDVCRAMICLQESPIEGERFIVSAQNLSYKECFDAIADALNKKKPSRYASKLMMTIAGIVQCLLQGKKAVLTKSIVSTAHKQSCFTNAKLTQALSFTFTPITDTIAFTAQCYAADKYNGKV